MLPAIRRVSLAGQGAEENCINRFTTGFTDIPQKKKELLFPGALFADYYMSKN
jgi:hypothetical protein